MESINPNIFGKHQPELNPTGYRPSRLRRRRLTYRIFINAPAPRIAPRSISAQGEIAGIFDVAGAVTAGGANELLPLFGSDVALDTPALLLMLPVVPGAAGGASVNVAVPPFASEAAVQETVPVVPTGGVVQLKPGAVIDWKSSDDGSVSVKMTFAAALGPPFVRLNV